MIAYGSYFRLITLVAGFLQISAAPAIGDEKIKILEKYFYSAPSVNGQEGARTQTNRIPNLPDEICFGWVINVTPQERLVKITEIFTLPAEPETWGEIETNTYSQTTTSKDRTTATTTRFMPLSKGSMENSWCLTKGDPSGAHHIVVLSGSRVLAEFEFEVHD